MIKAGFNFYVFRKLDVYILFYHREKGHKKKKGDAFMYLYDAILQCALTTFSITGDMMIWNEN